MHNRLRSLVIGLVFAPFCAIAAQDTVIVTKPLPPVVPVDTLRCGFCPRPNVPLALIQPLIFDVLLNRLNAWVLDDSTARVTPTTWRHNLRGGWDWDNDDFVVNMIGHPYMGSTYYAAARTNGLSYWAGAPLTVLQSVGWEYFGETTQPSVNDLVNTSLGGIALGEMFHRVAATIRSNQATGTARVLREIGAIPFDPVGSVNRLFRGEWGRIGPDPLEHNPVGTVLRTGLGAGIVHAPGTSAIDFKDANYTSILFADLKYGDAYIDTLRKPFDAFTLRILLAPGHGGLTQLVGVGRITGKSVGSEVHPRQLEVNQRFEYVNNGALQFGAQTIQLGFSTRTHIVERFWIRTLVAADAIVLAGINAPGAGTGPRTYDFGPGIGTTLSASIERGTVAYLTLRFQPAFTHTLDGATGADHFTSFSAVEANVPIVSRFSLVVHGTYYTRVSNYADGTSNSRSFPELLCSQRSGDRADPCWSAAAGYEVSRSRTDYSAMASNSSTCIACGRPFAENRELAAIPDASKIAFDPAHRRVWRICAGCGEWNLLGAEASAAALPELEARFAAHAPTGTTPALLSPARIGGGLELLRVGSIRTGDVDDSLGVELRAEVDRRRKKNRWLAIYVGVVAAAGVVWEVTLLHGNIRVWSGLLSIWAEVAFLMALAKRLGGGRVRTRSLVLMAGIALGLSALSAAVNGLADLRYQLIGLASVAPFLLIGGPLFRRYYPVVYFKAPNGTTIWLSKHAVERVTLSWDQATDEITLWDLPRGRTVSGESAIVTFLQLLPQLVQENLRQKLATSAVTEKAYNLLRAVGGLRGLLHALDGFRADNTGRVVLSELPAIYLVALDLAFPERSVGGGPAGDLRDRALEAAAVAYEAELLEGSNGK